MLSGSTMRLRSVRARSINWCSNISGVRTFEDGTAIADKSVDWSTDSANTRRAVSSFTVDDFVIGPRTLIRRSAVLKVPRSVRAIGRS